MFSSLLHCSHALAEPSWEGELALWRRVCDEAKIILTPGRDCHAAQPGFFRLCFAWVPPEALPEAIHRLKKVLPPPSQQQGQQASGGRGAGKEGAAA